MDRPKLFHNVENVPNIGSCEPKSNFFEQSKENAFYSWKK